MAENPPIDRVRAAIEQTTGQPARQQGSSWQLRCPAHHDRNPSLSLSENHEHHALLHCHSGCSTEDIIAAIGLQMRDLYPASDDRRADPVVATYDYTDQHGTLLYQVQRTAAKKFRQRRPDRSATSGWAYNLNDTRRVLYRLPQLIQAIQAGTTVYLVEGEKDVHTAEKLGAVATTNPGGAGKWRPEYSTTLRGAHLVIIADNDPSGVGLRHARTVAQAITPHVASLTVGLPVAGKDLTDLVTAGYGLDDITLIDLSGPNEPPTPTDTRTRAPEADDGAPGPVDDATGPRYILTPASQFPRLGAVWLWENPDTHTGWLVAGAIGLIGGREGVGKSTFLAWLAAQITRGTLPGIHHGTPKSVLYTANEDSWSYTIAPRLLAAGADLDRVYRVEVQKPDELPTGMSLPRDTHLLPQMARQVDAAILMCDPILSLVDQKINPNHSQEVRAALEPLSLYAEQAGIAVAALVHYNKNQDLDANSRVAGSGAWVQIPRTIMAIAYDTDTGDCVLSQTKNNRGAKVTDNRTYRLVDTVIEATDSSGQEIHVARVVWGDDTEVSAEQLLQRRPNGAGENNQGPVSQPAAILDYLGSVAGAQSPRQIADALTLERRSVITSLNRMLMRGQVRRVGTGLYTLGEEQS